jgi:integrase/recombinase XerD
LILFNRFLNGRSPTKELAQEFIMSLMDKHRKATITRHGYALRRYLEWLGLDSHLLLPTPERQLPDYLTEEELERLLKTARTPLEKVIITVLVSTGLRIDELLRLTLEDIDWKEGFVFAHREKTGMHGWIPIEEKALSALREYIAWKKIKGKKSKIFPYKYGDIWRWLKELGKLSGLGDRLHPHILRHTAAALRRLQGQSLEDLKELLGHKNIQTTTIYSALKSRELKERIKGVL